MTTDQGPLICVVDDDESIRDSMRALLRSAGWRVETFTSARDFLDRPRRETPGCLVLDVNLPGSSGLELQEQLARSGDHVSIIFVTGHGDIPMSVRAIKGGAIEFFTKPFIPADLLRAIEEGVARSGRHDAALAPGLPSFPGVIGSSPALRHVFAQVKSVASAESTVLVRGETGTGKELVARALHELSPRSHGPLVKVNCAAIPAGLLESELMGHEKGAFTGATARRVGRFELAQNGTIVLDEIGEMPLELQPKLLRLIQEREFERVGGNRTIQSNARIVASTHRDLEAMVRQGAFRQDLFYRVNVFPIRMPSLRERREDIEPLVRHFVADFGRRARKDIRTIPASNLQSLITHDWPGNIRELQNILERAVLLTEGSTLQMPCLDSLLGAADLAVERGSSPPVGMSATPTSASTAGSAPDADFATAQRLHILRVLDACNWTISGTSGAAARLGMKRSTLQFRMKKLGIVRGHSPSLR